MFWVLLLSASFAVGQSVEDKELPPAGEEAVVTSGVDADTGAAVPDEALVEETLQAVDKRLLTNIVIGVDSPAERGETDSIFDWREGSANTELRIKIESLLKDAGFQNRIRNYDKAISIYNEILEMDPENQYAVFSLGTALVQSERYREALEVLLPLMELYSNNHMVVNNVAWIYATADDLSIRNGEKAVAYARDALLLAPSDVSIWNTLSEAYFVSTKYEKALERANISLQMSISQNQPEERVRSMVEQVRKCRQAVATMSIME